VGRPVFTGFRDRHNRFHIADIVFKGVDVKPLTIRIAATAQIHGVYSQTFRYELLGHPSVVAAVSVEARNDQDGRARLLVRPPRAKGYL
jgi:hypothetical protein